MANWPPADYPCFIPSFYISNYQRATKRNSPARKKKEGKSEALISWFCAPQPCQHGQTILIPLLYSNSRLLWRKTHNPHNSGENCHEIVMALASSFCSVGLFGGNSGRMFHSFRPTLHGHDAVFSRNVPNFRSHRLHFATVWIHAHCLWFTFCVPHPLHTCYNKQDPSGVVVAVLG